MRPSPGNGGRPSYQQKNHPFPALQQEFGDKFGESLGGSQATPSFWEVPGLPQKFPKVPRKCFGDFPGSSLTVELYSNPRVPRRFPRLPRKFPGLPRKFPGLPRRSALSLGSLTPSPDSQKLSLKNHEASSSDPWRCQLRKQRSQGTLPCRQPCCGDAGEHHLHNETACKATNIRGSGAASADCSGGAHGRGRLLGLLMHIPQIDLQLASFVCKLSWTCERVGQLQQKTHERIQKKKLVKNRKKKKNPSLSYFYPISPSFRVCFSPIFFLDRWAFSTL